MIERASIFERMTDFLDGATVEAAFFTSYTFGQSFFEGDVLNPITEDGSRRGLVPVTVIVDRNRYSGSNYGYEVVRFPGNRLWHPKLMLMMVRDKRNSQPRTIFGVGSANLTRSGWEQNDELVSLQDWPGWRIPVLVHDWLKRPWLKQSRFGVWAKANANERKTLPNSKELLSSLDQPLWPQIVENYRVDDWDEAHLVAPFHDRTDMDVDQELGNQGHGGFLQQLCAVARSERSRLYLYLAPSIEEKGKCCVAADPGALERISRRVKLELRLIKPRNGGLFHAKEIAIRRGNSWCLVTGSPNATSAALVSSHGNVETVLCRVHKGSTIPKSFLPASQRVSLDQLQSLPRVVKEIVWDALDTAVYDVRQSKLKLTWREGYRLGNTDILFDGKRVTPDAFDHGESPCRALQTKPRSTPKKPVVAGYCPIVWKDEDEVPDVGRPRTPAMSPDDWLDALGSVIVSPLNDRGTLDRTVGSPSTVEAHQEAPFEWSDRVKRLDSSLGSLDAQLQKGPSGPLMSLLLRDAVGTWKAHDPQARGITEAESAWRKWVRAGLWQVVHRTPGQSAVARRAHAQAKMWSRSIRRKLKEFPIAPKTIP
jgi:hypothetical protein